MTRFAFHAAALALAALLPALASAHEYKAGAITIGHPWSRATPPGAAVAAGYLTLTNTGTTPDRLVGATAAIAGKGEIHEMSVSADGIMTMRPLADGLALPPGATVTLAPGSVHLMFLNLTGPAVADTRFSGTLTFEKAGTVSVDYAVEPIGGTPKGAADPHAAMDHSQMDHSTMGGMTMSPEGSPAAPAAQGN